MKFKIGITLAISSIAFAGCQQRINSVPYSPAVASADASPDAAIHTAIQTHLAHNSNLRLDSFDMEVKQIAFDGDRAQAHVEFHAKSGSGSLQLSYALAKRDGTWQVIESTPGGSNFSHPGLDKPQGPSATGNLGENSAVFQVLDKLHGGAPAPPQTLPPGHPSVGASPMDKQP
ncbi:MAG: hypothetical protein WBR10_20350 [Candidatus Acidiferrum sp.]